MKSKKKLLFLSSISVMSIVCAAAVLLANNNISMLDSYKEPYGISFSSAKNKFFPGTGSTDYSGQAMVKTNDNNNIQFNPEKKNIHLNNKNEKKIIVRIFI